MNRESEKDQISRRKFVGKSLMGIAAIGAAGCSAGGGDGKKQAAAPESKPAAEAGMTVDELKKMVKIDSHIHLRGMKPEEEAPLLATLEEHNMRWFDICTRGMGRKFLYEQIDQADSMHRKYGNWFNWATSFSLENWGAADWQQSAIDTIDETIAMGAQGVKVWKEIGMVLKDPDGTYVMIDDERFDPILDHISSLGKTLVAHIGEPRNCWLPLEEMTVNNDRKYFEEFPKYHSYLHPEIPHYIKHIEAKDRVMDKHPDLRVVGCHLGTLEYSVDELAWRFEKYPNFAVDLAARVCHFQVQDRDKVRDFCIKYQDRILYGTDLGAGFTYMKTDIDGTIEKINTTYDKDYRYFATDEEMEVWEVNGAFRGLGLPRTVLEKMFYGNMLKWYPGVTA